MHSIHHYLLTKAVNVFFTVKCSRISFVFVLTFPLPLKMKKKRIQLLLQEINHNTLHPDSHPQVDMVNRSAMMDLSNYMSNGEWALLDTSITRNEVVYPISPAVYPDITIAISIQRRIIYYILNIIMPCVWLNVLNLLAFCLPPDAGEKITLGITVFLSYSIFMLLIAESMPPTSEFVPLIGEEHVAFLSFLSFRFCIDEASHYTPHFRYCFPFYLLLAFYLHFSSSFLDLLLCFIAVLIRAHGECSSHSRDGLNIF